MTSCFEVNSAQLEVQRYTTFSIIVYIFQVVPSIHIQNSVYFLKYKVCFGEYSDIWSYRSWALLSLRRFTDELSVQKQFKRH